MDPKLPNELSARVKFADVVKRMEKISNTKNIDEKAKILGRFFNAVFELQKKFRDEGGSLADASFYPFLRLFIPNKDSERGSYGIKTTTLGRLYVKALAINAKGETAKKMTKLEGNSSDYGDIIYDVMKNRSPEFGTLTVYEVNEYLDLIADHFQDNERSKIDTQMVKMLKGMSAIDRKWLTRILLKKLRLGLGDQRILGLYDSRASEFYNQCSYLSDVCKACETNSELKTGIVELFKPIRPMLCERGYISQINRMLTENDYFLETKMDGERCMLHINGTEFKYFSRNCREDFTKTFGANNRSGLYSPILHHHLNGNIDTAIFDGEMMVWDCKEKIFLKKAENFTAKHLDRNDEKLNPCYCIYDIIYYNGSNLMDKPYAERIRLLHTLVRQEKGTLMLCERIKIRDSGHFLECLNKAFDANEEGVVIKQAGSKYQPGQREKGGWFKMKPDYENLVSDFDLLIIGGFYNDTRTAVDSFLLGVLKKGSTEIDTVFYSVCKVRNGFKRSQMSEICDRLKPYLHKVNGTKDSPAGIEWANSVPDFWIEPKKSIVVQIKASELVETTRYRTSHSFRFPRVMEIRWDKEWQDACSLNEFQGFCCHSNSKVEKLTKRHATAVDLIAPVPKRRRQGPSNAPSTSTTNTTNVEAVDAICNGLDFCIQNGEKKSHSVEELGKMVCRHGGRVVKYPSNKTFVVIAGDKTTARVEDFIKKGLYNIASPQWLVRALGSDKPLTKLIKFTPSDMVFATPTLKEQFDMEMDMCDEVDTPPLNFDSATQPLDDQPNDEQHEFESEPVNPDVAQVTVESICGDTTLKS